MSVELIIVSHIECCVNHRKCLDIAVCVRNECCDVVSGTFDGGGDVVYVYGSIVGEFGFNVFGVLSSMWLLFVLAWMVLLVVLLLLIV